MPRPAVAFFFSKVGAEELADAPEAIEIPVVLWQEARCAGVEEFAGAAEDFPIEGVGAAFEDVA